MKKICAILVTYNREKYLEKLLKSLIEQSYKINSCIIVDNHGTDNTKNMLLANNIIKEFDIQENKLYKNIYENINFYYFYNSINSGGAGGFNKAFEILLNLDEQFDYVWVMDDDVLPEKDCLEKLKANMKEEIGICIPNRSDEKFKDYAVTRFNLKNPFLVYMQKKKKVGNFINKLYEIYDMPFEGPLFNAKIIKKVGLPDKEYFIFYDDSDYCQRCLKYSRALFITDAILHKQIIPKENKSKRLNWRHYYSYRNCIYFDKKYGKNWFVKNLTPKLFIIELMIKNIILFRFYNLKIILKEYKDANKNIRGKTIEPGCI